MFSGSLEMSRPQNNVTSHVVQSIMWVPHLKTATPSSFAGIYIVIE
jgi:hypothetical protein